MSMMKLVGTDERPWPQKNVRLATPTDIEPLMTHCARLNEENGIVEMQSHMVRAEIENAVAMKLALIGIIGEEKIEASVCLRCAHYWYNDQFWWLEDRWLYVEPEHRNTRNARDLLEFAKWWADQLSAPLMMGIVSNTQTEAKCRLYRRILGSPTGEFFLVGARTGNVDVQAVGN